MGRVKAKAVSLRLCCSSAGHLVVRARPLKSTCNSPIGFQNWVVVYQGCCAKPPKVNLLAIQQVEAHSKDSQRCTVCFSEVDSSCCFMGGSFEEGLWECLGAICQTKTAWTSSSIFDTEEGWGNKRAHVSRTTFTTWVWLNRTFQIVSDFLIVFLGFSLFPIPKPIFFIRKIHWRSYSSGALAFPDFRVVEVERGCLASLSSSSPLGPSSTCSESLGGFRISAVTAGGLLCFLRYLRWDSRKPLNTMRCNGVTADMLSYTWWAPLAKGCCNNPL